MSRIAARREEVGVRAFDRAIAAACGLFEVTDVRRYLAREDLP